MALDLGISLEMLLLFTENKKERPDQLSLTFRIRGAWLVGVGLEDRKKVYSALGTIYSHRSQVAHNGEIDYQGLDHTQISDQRKVHLEVAERIFQKLILIGCIPDWKEIILGGSLPE